MGQGAKKILLLTIAALLSAFTSADALQQNSTSNSGRLVDIGGGRKMYIECQGTGSPTVVFVSGRADRADIWKTVEASAPPGPAVFPAIAKVTRVCIYDRPGTVTIEGDKVTPSRSTSVPQPISPKECVNDLHALLKAAKVPGPYVLVGHSYGGLIVRLYASTYPCDVVGLVLVDTLTEFLYDSLTPEQQKLWVRLNSNYPAELDNYTVQERTDFARSFDQMHKSAPLRPMPAVVLTTDQPYDFKPLIANGTLPPDAPVDFGPILYQAHLNAQDRLAETLHAEHISDTHAGHYVHTEQPQLVIAAIKDVIDKVRAKKSMKCTP
jgi:pimeloyl-ACP methyl ester carboxylesterase